MSDHDTYIFHFFGDGCIPEHRGDTPCGRFTTAYPTHAHDLGQVQCARCGWHYSDHRTAGYYEVTERGSNPLSEPDHTAENVAPSGAELIAAERRRQVEVEGWTPDHDDEHNDSGLLLARAARCYVDAAVLVSLGLNPNRPVEWPWDAFWWKPSDDPIRNLVKAGALIAAELDRLQRRPIGRAES